MNLADYPTGFVTLVFTDIQGSTELTNKLNATERAHYETAVRNPHRDYLFASLKEHGGKEIQRAGDGHMLVFQEPQQAIACLTEFQNKIRDEPINTQVGDEEFVVRVRAGIHTTARTIVPQLKEENGQEWIEYPGQDTNFAARISALGDGGQILLSQSTYDRAQPEISQLRTHAWPDRYLKSFAQAPQTVHELLYHDGQEPREPGLRLFSAWYQDERNRYIAREVEEQAVITRFANPVRGTRPRLVTIHAEGGMGKTRLSIACALKMVDIFEHNIHFVKLADTLPTPYAVAEAIGSVLGKSGPQAQPDALIESLRHSQLLLLLDNYESCAHDEVAHFLARLITQTTGVHLLVTGRQPVGVRNIEQIVSLSGGLTYPQAHDLFLERAALDGIHQQLPTNDEEVQLNRILQLVSVNPDDASSGPIPLAVELAAAWWNEKTLKEIADGIEKTPLKKYMAPVPGMVADDHAESGTRHESLDRSLEWSYDLLGKIPEIGPRLQTMFAFCGLFPETFDSEIVQTISSAPDTDDILIRLHRASMLQKRGTTERTLYRLHHFGREYAREKLLAIPDGTALKSAFIAHYATLIEEHKNINDLRNHPILDESWRNALSATQWAVQTQSFQRLFELMDGLTPFLDLRGLWSEWESLCLQLLALMCKVENRRGEGIALNDLGIVYQTQNRWEEAEQAYTQDLFICRELKDRVGEGGSLNNLGIVYEVQKRWEEAEQAYMQSLTIKREFKDRAGEGRTLNNLGVMYQSQNRWQEAEQAHTQSLTIKREFKDHMTVGQTLNNLGIVYEAQNRWEEAEQAYTQDLFICREFKDRVGEGLTLENIAALRAAQGDLTCALDFAQQSVDALSGTQAVVELEKAQTTLNHIKKKMDANPTS